MGAAQLSTGMPSMTPYQKRLCPLTRRLAEDMKIRNMVGQVVFTLPSQLSRLALSNRESLADLLFRSARENAGIAHHNFRKRRKVMNRSTILHAAAVAALLVIAAPLVAQETPKSYPITFKADDVHTINNFSIELNALKLTGSHLMVVPILCEPGITGAMLIGKGDYEFTPAGGDVIKGVFRAAMLRFNPMDQPKLLPINHGDATTDHAVHEMGRHMLDNVFRHCWHSGMNALIPDAGSLVANVYSTTQGDLLISTGPDSSVVHSFTNNATLYTKK